MFVCIVWVHHKLRYVCEAVDTNMLSWLETRHVRDIDDRFVDNIVSDSYIHISSADSQHLEWRNLCDSESTLR